MCQMYVLIILASFGSSDHSRPSSTSSQRDLVAMEIFSTEESYNQNLEHIITVNFCCNSLPIILTRFILKSLKIFLLKMNIELSFQTLFHSKVLVKNY